jgi:hypothetical protein
MISTNYGNKFSSMVLNTAIAVIILISSLLSGCTAQTGSPGDTLTEPCSPEYQTALELGGEWFLNNQNKNFLYYEYNWASDKYSDQQHPLREMASMWAIARLSRYLDDARYAQLAQKGFSYFERYFEYDSEHDFYYFKAASGEAEIGESAFIILSLLEMDHPKKDFYLQKFANGIMFQQQPDGSLKTIFYSDVISSVDYYPGEALLAIMSLYEYKKDDKYLSLVKKAFPYYADYFESNKNTAFVPWQTRANLKLYRATKDKEVADFIFEMNDFMLDFHAPQNEVELYNLSRGINTAVYLEGVNKAFELARETGDSERQELYSSFVKEGFKYILTLQLTDSPSVSRKAIGGFLSSKTSVTLRVDNNQHAVMALMDACELGLLSQ